MNSDQPLEGQIRDVLDSEHDAISLSDKLFSPHGLFSRMATTESECRAVAQSELFKEAQTRLAELRRIEAESFSKAIEESGDSVGRGPGSSKSNACDRSLLRGWWRPNALAS
jgi:hypothetical protein